MLPLLVSVPLKHGLQLFAPQSLSQVTFMFCPVFFFFKIDLFIYGCAGSLLPRAGLLQLQQADFSLQWLLLLQSTHVRESRLSSCSSRVPQYLWRMGLVAVSYVGSSWTRDQICVCCIGRRILYHQATREALVQSLCTWSVGELWSTESQSRM